MFQDPTPSTTRKGFFISYTDADEEWAVWVATELERLGYTTTYMKRDFSGVGSFVEAIDKTLLSCRHIVAIHSQDYIRSTYAPMEWQYAKKIDPDGSMRMLLLVLVDETQPIGLLSLCDFVDLSSCQVGSEQAQTELTEKVNEVIQNTKQDLISTETSNFLRRDQLELRAWRLIQNELKSRKHRNELIKSDAAVADIQAIHPQLQFVSNSMREVRHRLVRNVAISTVIVFLGLWLTYLASEKIWQWTHVSPKQLAELQEDVANSHLSQFKKFSIRERLVSAGEAENRDAQIAKVSSVIELLEAAKHYVDNSPEVSREQTTHRITQKIFEIFVGGDNNESASGIMPNFEKTLRDGGNRSAPNGKPIKDWIAEIDYDCYVFVGQATSHERPVANALVWLGVYQLLEEKRITLKLDRLIEIFANVKTELEKTKNNNKKPSKPTEWSDSAKLSFAETTVNNTIEIIKRKYRALAEEKDKKIVRHYRDWYDRGLRNLFPSSKYEEQLREQLRNKLQMYVGLWEGPSTSTLAKGND